MAAQDHLRLHLADIVQGPREQAAVHVVEPRGVDGRPEDLPDSQIFLGEFIGALRYS